MFLNVSKTKYIIFHVQGKRTGRGTTLQIDANLPDTAPPPPSWIVLLNAHRLPRSSSLNTTATEPWSTDENRAMFLTLCSTPSTDPLLRDVSSNLAVPYNSFVCLSCPPVSILHPLPRPMRVGSGQKPKSLQLLIPLPAHPSLLPLPCTYPHATQNSSHFICHLVKISRWPSTLACHLLIFHLCYV